MTATMNKPTGLICSFQRCFLVVLATFVYTKGAVIRLKRENVGQFGIRSLAYPDQLCPIVDCDEFQRSLPCSPAEMIPSTFVINGNTCDGCPACPSTLRTNNETATATTTRRLRVTPTATSTDVHGEQSTRTTSQRVTPPIGVTDSQLDRHTPPVITSTAAQHNSSITASVTIAAQERARVTPTSDTDAVFSNRSTTAVGELNYVKDNNTEPAAKVAANQTTTTTIRATPVGTASGDEVDEFRSSLPAATPRNTPAINVYSSTAASLASHDVSESSTGLTGRPTPVALRTASSTFSVLPSSSETFTQQRKEVNSSKTDKIESTDWGSSPNKLDKTAV